MLVFCPIITCQAMRDIIHNSSLYRQVIVFNDTTLNFFV